MNQKIVISCFDLTGNMVKPWADAGYLCYCVDLQHKSREAREGNIIYVKANMLDWLPPRGDIAAAFFFPPCTDVAVSGAKHFRDKGLGALIRTLELFNRSVNIAEMIGAPYMIENPVSTVSTYWRKPDYTFHPHEYAGLEPADNYTKKTCLWTGGGSPCLTRTRTFRLGNRMTGFTKRRPDQTKRISEARHQWDLRARSLRQTH